MRRLLCTLLCTALAACADSPTAPDPGVLARELPLPEGTIGSGATARVRSVGDIVPDGDSLLLHVPASVRRGQPLAVAYTIGTGGCTGMDTTMTTVSGQTATIVPYVSRPSDLSAILCAALFIPVRVTSPVVFTQVGEARVRLVVRAGRENTLQVIERRVQVTD